jgi:ribosomal protein S18 acetylase RimI-like enzyme
VVRGFIPRIRPAQRRDFDRVLALWAGARSSHARTPDTPEALETLVGRDGDALLVADDDGEIVGTLIAAFDGWRGGMYRLAVAPEWRRRGVGAMLISEGERRLRVAGARRVTALVGSEDEVAAAVWRAAGYDRDPYVARFVKNL